MSDKAPTLGQNVPYIFSDEGELSAGIKVVELIDELIVGHEEENVEASEDSIHAVSATLSVLVVEDQYREAFELMPHLLQTVNEEAINCGYVVMSARPMTLDLKEHQDDGTLPEENRGGRYALAIKVVLVDWEKHLASDAGTLDSDGDPLAPYWWERLNQEAIHMQAKMAFARMATGTKTEH